MPRVTLSETTDSQGTKVPVLVLDYEIIGDNSTGVGITGSLKTSDSTLGEYEILNWDTRDEGEPTIAIPGITGGGGTAPTVIPITGTEGSPQQITAEQCVAGNVFSDEEGDDHYARLPAATVGLVARFVSGCNGYGFHISVDPELSEISWPGRAPSAASVQGVDGQGSGLALICTHEETWTVLGAIGPWDVDGVADSTYVYSAKTTLNASQLAALDTTPVELVPAPGAGKTIIVQQAILTLRLNGGTADDGGAQDTSGDYGGVIPYYAINTYSGFQNPIDSITICAGTTPSGLSDGVSAMTNSAVMLVCATPLTVTGSPTLEIEVQYNIKSV